MKPILETFKAAGRLAKEWRDTIGYTVGLAGAGSFVWHEHYAAIPAVLFASYVRECLRTYSWGKDPENLCFAGAPSKTIDTLKNMSASNLVSCIPGIGCAVSMAIIFNPLWAGCVIPLSMAAGCEISDLIEDGGKFSDIWKLYTDKETGMWDWPRRRPGGGITQTHKFKDAAAETGTKIIRKVRSLIPRPAADMTGVALAVSQMAAPL